jgi:hypothetical protein
MLGTPPPPHVCDPLHVPQVNVPPHPSGIVPQFFPCAAQVVATQLAGVTLNRLASERGPSVAVSVTVVVVATADVVTVSTATLLPGAIVVLVGSDATGGLLLLSATVGPPVFEMPLSQMVALELLPPVTASGLISKKPSTGCGAAGGFCGGGAIASQARPVRSALWMPPPLIGVGISKLASTSANWTDGMIDVATVKGTFVVPAATGRKPLGNAVATVDCAIAIAVVLPDGAGLANRRFAVAGLPPSTHWGAKSIGYGPLVAQASKNWKLLDGFVVHPSKHSWRKLHLPTVPKSGPTWQSNRIP